MHSRVHTHAYRYAKLLAADADATGRGEIGGGEEARVQGSEARVQGSAGVAGALPQLPAVGDQRPAADVCWHLLRLHAGGVLPLYPVPCTPAVSTRAFECICMCIYMHRGEPST